MIEILGTTYYTHGYAALLFVLIAVVTLTLFSIFRWRYPKAIQLPKGKLLALKATFLVVLFFALHWDIILVGHQVSKLCKEEGGLHVYKTVKADSVAGLYGIKYWSEYGFLYVEDVTTLGGKVRLSMVGGEVVKEPINEFISPYEFKSKSEFNIARYVKKTLIWKDRKFIVDRQTAEVLGEYTCFIIGQGWADQWLPMNYIPWQCGNVKFVDEKKEYLTSSSLVKAVVKPKR